LELFKIFGRIAVNNEEAHRELANTTGKAKEASEKIGKFFGSVAKTVGKASLAAIGAAATGIAALTKSAVENYAEYEQLVGGVETLFKDSSAKVLEYANNAYKTAGLSANDYMETVTSFSASLLQSLGGDTVKAAEIGNMAVVDMADNANKMGSSMESIQNAYAGFAKQNYTMLDNLKLGYGGTKEEMQRLIDDANALNKAQGNMTKYSIDSYADIVNAIHDVQTEMGVTGTTALEASTTIQGSLASTKAAWDNWLTGTGSVDALVGTVVNSAKLLAKAIGDILPSLTTGISQLVAQLAPEIPPLINQLLPGIIDSIVTLIDSLGSQLPAILATILPVITGSAPQIINTLITALISSLPIIVSSAGQLILALAAGISQSLPTLIPTIVDVVLQIVMTLVENVNLLVDAAVDLISALAEGLIAALPILIAQAPTIISRLVQELIAAAPQLLLSAAEIVVQIVSGIADNLFALGKSAGEIITTIVEGIGEMWGSLVGVGSQVVAKIREGISNAWQGLKNWFKGIWDGLFGNLNVDVNVNGNNNSGGGGGGYDPTGGNPSFAASGIDFVPYNRFPAILHEGEAVLTASEADAWRKGNGGAGNGVVINQYINAPAQTPVQLASATAAYFEQARWAI
jgi:phage-related protein